MARILIVDDNRAIHADFQKILAVESRDNEDVMARVLGRERDPDADHRSYEIDSAYQGAKAAEMVERARSRHIYYAMAFVDMRMPPGWSGVQTTAALWKLDARIQVVICTAFSDFRWDEVLAELGRSEGLHLLRKPFEPAHVRKLVDVLTKKWSRLNDANTHTRSRS